MLQSCMNSFQCVYAFCLLSLWLTGLPAITSAQSDAHNPNYARCHEMRRLLHWEHFPLHLYFTEDPVVTRERRERALAGFNEWVHATKGIVCYQVVTDPAQADITVTITQQVDEPGAAQTIGQTDVSYADTVIMKATVQLVDQNDDAAQFQEISAHEFGHALGIDGHSDDPNDIMFPVLSHSLFQARNFEVEPLVSPNVVTTRDVNTLKTAYPASMFASSKH